MHTSSCSFTVHNQPPVSSAAALRSYLTLRRRCGQVDFVRFLLKVLLSPKAQTCVCSLGSSLFSCRLKPFFGLVLTASLQHGASVDARAHHSATPLHHCCENSHPQGIPLLLDACANVNAREKNHGRMPVHLAARSGCVDAVIQLALARADLNAPDAYSRTALHEACWAACTSHIAVRSPPLV